MNTLHWKERLHRAWYGWALALILALASTWIADRLVYSVPRLNEVESEFAVNSLGDMSRPVAWNKIALIVANEDTWSKLDIGPEHTKIPRRHWARVLSLLDQAGARVAVCDLLMRKPWPEEDVHMVSALENLRNLRVVLATDGMSDQDVTLTTKTPQGRTIEFIEHPIVTRKMHRVHLGCVRALPINDTVAGAFLLDVDTRHGTQVPWISVAAACAWHGVRNESVEYLPDKHIVRAETMRWQVNESVAMEVRPTAAKNPFATYELVEAITLLQDPKARSPFRDKMILLGVINEDDVVEVPSLGRVPGVVFVAQMTNTVMQGITSDRVPDAFSLSGTALLAWVAGIGILRRRWITALALPVLSLALTYLLVTKVLPSWDLRTELVRPVLATACASVASMLIVAWKGHNIDHRPAGVLEEATILFADLRHSTVLTQQLGADSYQKLHTRLNQLLLRAISSQHGTIERTTGDGVIAVFRAAHTGLHTIHAIKAVQQIQSQVHQVTSGDPRLVAADIDLAFGLESGLVSGGYVVEREQRVWSSSGSAVNMAQRLQSGAGGWGIRLAIGPVAARFIEQEFHPVLHTTASLKGFERPIEVWALPQDKEPSASQRIDIPEDKSMAQQEIYVLDTPETFSASMLANSEVEVLRDGRNVDPEGEAIDLTLGDEIRTGNLSGGIIWTRMALGQPYEWELGFDSNTSLQILSDSEAGYSYASLTSGTAYCRLPPSAANYVFVVPPVIKRYLLRSRGGRVAVDATEFWLQRNQVNSVWKNTFRATSGKITVDSLNASGTVVDSKCYDAATNGGPYTFDDDGYLP